MAEKKVIDVSKHNGVIDWAKVKKSGIYGAIIRCGYGDNVESQDDIKFKYNADECTRLGIPFGVYIYSYAKTDAQAKSEAEHVLRLVKGYELSFPIYYDLEEPGTEQFALSNAKVFCDIIEKAGYMCGIYTGEWWWNNYLKGFDKYTKWVAKWSSNKPNVNKVDMWQYSNKGQVDGIKGDVDMNYLYRNFDTIFNAGKVEKEEKPVKKPAKTEKPATETTAKKKYKLGIYRTKVALNLRQCANKESAKVGVMSAGKTIEVLQIQNECWGSIRYNGKLVWICIDSEYANFIREAAEEKTYTIKKGDTLSQIAAKHNTTVAKLAELNNIKDVNKIYAGDTIKIN